MGYWNLNSPPVRLPNRRILRAFAFDPMSTRLSGRYLSVNIPFESNLEPGPNGELVQVVDYDAPRGTWYRPLDLDDPAVLAQNGLQPSESDPRSHQQVVYAVAMSVIERFERFIGRRFRWRGDSKLRMVPHAFEGRNAFFDPARGAVLFGYYRADSTDTEANLPGQQMFTCLSVDVVAHEVTHAIVHRMRKYFSTPTNPDVYAWHEAFADLVALFHHFVFPEVIAEAVAASSSDLRKADALFELAKEFGRSTGRAGALRSAISDTEPTPEAFRSSTEAHERGGIFVAAVFDAYLQTYRSQIRDLQRLSTGGTGVLPEGAIPPDLVKRVTLEAVRGADRMLGMVVRAFDFLPVVDVTFGDVVRSIITADRILFPEDALHLRATLVACLRRRGIYPPGVSSLADEALAWAAPVVPLNLARDADNPVDLSQLIYEATLKLDTSGALDPARSGGEDDESADLGNALFRSMNAWARAHALELGLDPLLKVELAGIHVAYLQAADGQPRPIIVAQLAQRHVELEEQDEDPGKRIRMMAGTTVIARVDGAVEYLVCKPLPLSDPTVLIPVQDDAIAAFARDSEEAGADRLRRMREWFGLIESADALTIWSDEPALARLTFGRLHGTEAR